jgi:CheY-like chemotaxis protein
LLIADDDPDAAEMLAELLRLLLPPPLEIILAYDGQEALTAATGLRTPDAVILDFEMPRMNGVNAAVGIRRALGRRTPTIIAVTGYVGVGKLAEGNSAFDHVLPKPVEVAELLGLLPSRDPARSTQRRRTPGALPGT